MAEQTNRKGGRRWWGKAEAKAAGRRTRRRDDATETEMDVLDEEERAWPHGSACPACMAPNAGARHMANCEEE